MRSAKTPSKRQKLTRLMVSPTMTSSTPTTNPRRTTSRAWRRRGSEQCPPVASLLHCTVLLINHSRPATTLPSTCGPSADLLSVNERHSWCCHPPSSRSFSLLQTHALELRALRVFCLIGPDNDGKAEDTSDVLWMLRGGPEVSCNTHWAAEPNNKIASDHLGEKQEIHAMSRAARSPLSGAAATL